MLQEVTNKRINSIFQIHFLLLILMYKFKLHLAENKLLGANNLLSKCFRCLSSQF